MSPTGTNLPPPRAAAKRALAAEGSPTMPTAPRAPSAALPRQTAAATHPLLHHGHCLRAAAEGTIMAEATGMAEEATGAAVEALGTAEAVARAATVRSIKSRPHGSPSPSCIKVMAGQGSNVGVSIPRGMTAGDSGLGSGVAALMLSHEACKTKGISAYDKLPPLTYV
mmetsp:Transcript_77482/g.171570  ORF Transcript_77482/g.171570 Transcript_77482/m.171570 type:complete len:168 (-) Transcript_77482:114-617(-)